MWRLPRKAPEKTVGERTVKAKAGVLTEGVHAPLEPREDEDREPEKNLRRVGETRA